MPLSMGGIAGDENLQILCAQCNSRKGASIPADPLDPLASRLCGYYPPSMNDWGGWNGWKQMGILISRDRVAVGWVWFRIGNYTEDEAREVLITRPWGTSS